MSAADLRVGKLVEIGYDYMWKKTLALGILIYIDAIKLTLTRNTEYQMSFQMLIPVHLKWQAVLYNDIKWQAALYNKEISHISIYLNLSVCPFVRPAVSPSIRPRVRLPVRPFVFR